MCRYLLLAHLKHCDIFQQFVNIEHRESATGRSLDFSNETEELLGHKCPLQLMKACLGHLSVCAHNTTVHG